MYIQDEGPKSPLYTRMSIELLGYEYLEQATDNSSQRVTLNTTRGPIEGIYHEPMHSESFAVVWASGARGGFDGPSNAIYADLAEYFAESNKGPCLEIISSTTSSKGSNLCLNIEVIQTPIE